MAGIGIKMAQNRSKMGQKWVKNGSKMGHFGTPFLTGLGHFDTDFSHILSQNRSKSGPKSGQKWVILGHPPDPGSMAHIQIPYVNVPGIVVGG